MPETQEAIVERVKSVAWAIAREAHASMGGELREDDSWPEFAVYYGGNWITIPIDRFARAAIAAMPSADRVAELEQEVERSREDADHWYAEATHWHDQSGTAEAQVAKMREALGACRPVLSRLISTHYNVETWELKQRLSAVDAALSEAPAPVAEAGPADGDVQGLIDHLGAMARRLDSSDAHLVHCAMEQLSLQSAMDELRHPPQTGLDAATLEAVLQDTWESATNSVCQTLQDAKMCKCASGECVAVKVNPSEADRKIFFRALTAPASPPQAGLDAATLEAAARLAEAFEGDPEIPEKVLFQFARHIRALSKGAPDAQ